MHFEELSKERLNLHKNQKKSLRFQQLMLLSFVRLLEDEELFTAGKGSVLTQMRLTNWRPVS
jgi:hypothetical protein